MPLLAGELTTLAFCWRLERRDGVCLGFTTHDRLVTVQGVAYRPAPGLMPSAVTLTDGFEAAALDVKGALTSDALTAEDLEAGRWDGAGVSLFVVDWEAPDGTSLALARGELGEISLRGGAFEVELRGPAALLERRAVEQTSPECRAELGDARCRVDMGPRTLLTRIVAVIDHHVVQVESISPDDNAYGYGRLRWLTGANSGLESAVLASAGHEITLRAAPFGLAAVGNLVELREGCDRSFETCAGRFANGLNFRGEPHLPGMDLLTRYPGAA